MIKKIKIKYKLLIISLFSTMTVIISAASFWTYDSIQSYKENLQQRIYNQGEIISSNITAAILFEDTEEAKKILYALKKDQAIASVSLYSKNEKENINLKFQNPKKEHSTNIAYKALMLFHKININTQKVTILHNKEPIGNITINYHDREIHEKLFEYIFSISIISLISVIMGVILSSSTQSLVTRPIAHLSSTAKKVRLSKDYSLRGKFFYPDEIGDLTQDFNSMLEIIEEREHDLEELVRIRTQQLEKQNEELETQITKRKLSDALREESEEKFEKAFINAPIGMALLDKSGLLFRKNQTLDTILKHHQQKTNLSPSIYEIINQNPEKNISKEIEQLSLGKTTQFECETECFSDHQNPIIAILSFSAVYSSDNKFLYIVLQFQDVTDARKMAADLKHQATHDSLTGIANRRYLEKTLNDTLTTNRTSITTLCVLDLDQFKIVNDTCGHLAGDELLKNISNILIENIRKNDILARLGGDEFALILFECDREKAYRITENLRRKIEEYDFFWDNNLFRVGVSIGAICINPTEITDLPTIMQKADSACYTAKDLGRNRVYIVDDDDTKILNRHGEAKWVNRINASLSNDNFILYIQTVLPLNEDTINKRYEVLIRMKDEKDGSIISPNAFIPIAERYGLTTKIDMWVVNKLIESLHRDNTLLYQRSYWVNLSGASFGDNRFIQLLEKTIKESGLPTGTINFEITETSFMKNMTEAKVAMLKISELGCQFALDDFGSGVSSFGYLKYLPVDFIKIDGMFVKDIMIDKIDYIFVKSIIDIAKVMGIKTIAEFVESEEIRTKLAEMGADFGQGYALGRPYPLLKNNLSIT